MAKKEKNTANSFTIVLKHGKKVEKFVKNYTK